MTVGDKAVSWESSFLLASILSATDPVAVGTLLVHPIASEIGETGILVDVSDIFFFFCSGEWKGEPEEPGGGGDNFLLKIPGGGGVSRAGGGEGRGAGRVFAGNLGGGG